MLKSQAINLLGGSPSCAAVALGVSYQAVNKWPDKLPDRIADRVLGACVRCGIAVPKGYTDSNRSPYDVDSLDISSKVNAGAPLTADPALEAELSKAEQAGLVLLPKKAPVWDGSERRRAIRRAFDIPVDITSAEQGG